jgi:lipase maturation factor 1
LNSPTNSSYEVSTWLFARTLGAIYLVAFLSLWAQIHGLISSTGILPVQDLLDAAEKVGTQKYWFFPTVFWLSASDAFLGVVCGAGVFVSLLLIVGVIPSLSLLALWVLYLSLTTACREFLGFQWDNLLLEAGFFSIFLIPFHVLPKSMRGYVPSVVMRWLFLVLLFKLMFSSGVVKRASGDPSWLGFTALNFHYETQPLPTWIGWYAHQLPTWFHQMSVAVIVSVELLIPFFIFASRRLRLIAAVLFIFLQGLIFLTGNYCFFNVLTVALCLLLVDDGVWSKVFPGKTASEMPRLRTWPKGITLPILVFFVAISSLQVARAAGLNMKWMRPAVVVERALHPFRTINSYGLFAVMTTTRREIVAEGSNDGKNWLPYAMKWQPQDVKKRPRFVAPHQPRWEVIRATLGSLVFCVVS